MSERPFTLLDEGRVAEVAARVAGDRVVLTPEALEAGLGWQLKPEGLCRGGRCVPVSRHGDRIGASGIDLSAFAEALGRPLALDAEEGVACLGTPAAQRAAQQSSLEAPDFTLPDLEGKLHSLSDYRDQKRLLVAWASW